MNEMQKSVQMFHHAFRSDHPVMPDLVNFPGELRITLIREELDEFETAVHDRDLVAVVDSICDLLYVTFGAAVALGVDIQPFFDEVHRSNMHKRGGPKREDGKVLKPQGWSPPDIEGLLYDLYGIRAVSRSQR